MGKKILVVDGHPDARDDRFVHALAASYSAGASSAGHEVRVCKVAELEFPWLRTSDEFLRGRPPLMIAQAQKDIAWCEHCVILYPLWLGSMPALLKAYFEQLMRPGFAFADNEKRGLPRKLLKNKSARIVVTMGMPSLFYKWVFRAHSLKSLERNVLRFVGFGPVHTTVVGSVESMGATKRIRWLERVRAYGAAAR